MDKKSPPNFCLQNLGGQARPGGIARRLPLPPLWDLKQAVFDHEIVVWLEAKFVGEQAESYEKEQ